jgi:hypothetical protein
MGPFESPGKTGRPQSSALCRARSQPSCRAALVPCPEQPALLFSLFIELFCSACMPVTGTSD